MWTSTSLTFGRAVADGAFHLSAENVRLAEDHRRFGLHVQVDEVTHAELPHAHFFNRQHARNAAGRLADRVEQIALGRAVHQVVDGRPQQAHSVDADDDRRHGRGPIVGGRTSRAHSATAMPMKAAAEVSASLR